ncbi:MULTISPECIES: hypothetical protein [Paenibacillus]|nr:MULTISPECIES: hypothetical protein [Paenibacillus]
MSNFSGVIPFQGDASHRLPAIQHTACRSAADPPDRITFVPIEYKNHVRRNVIPFLTFAVSPAVASNFGVKNY